MRFSAMAAVMTAAVSAAAFAQPANSCADPYWKYTLRCQFFPTQPPQPANATPPPPATAIPKFTRIWLDANPQVRCVDGTMPLIYVDKAVCTNPAGCGSAAYGAAIDADRWMFTIPGGGACHAGYCPEFYAQPSERNEMSSAAEPEMKNLGAIHDPDPVRNPVFAGYNRVRVEKCGFDRYIGRASIEAPGGAFHATRRDGTPLHYNLYHHGALHIEEAFALLEKGLRYSTWTRSGGSTVRTTETLPPLADAEVVLVVGHSGASHGLYHNVDNIAAALARMPRFRGDVRAVLDANFIPAPENEAAFASTAPAGSDAYSGIAAGTSATSTSGVFSYDAKVHFESGLQRQQYDAWGSQLDTSCLQTHQRTDGQEWRCRDRYHVLFHHLTTPFFLREDFTDPNLEHLDVPRGHRVQWAEDAFYADCTESTPCDPRLTPAEYRARLEKQAGTLIESSSTRSELARGIDGSGVFPSFYVWMPDCGRHEGAYDETSFFTVAMRSYTMAEWLESFLTMPRSGTRAWLIDGLPDSSGALVQSHCQGLRPSRRRSVRH